MKNIPLFANEVYRVSLLSTADDMSVTSHMFPALSKDRLSGAANTASGLRQGTISARRPSSAPM